MAKRLLMVIAPQDFRDEELLEPYNVFTKENAWEVTVASIQAGDARGMLGHIWPVSELIQDQNPDNYDAIVVVGGMGSLQYLWENAVLHQLIREFNAQGKVVSAICLSGAVLAKAGVLTGKSATVWEAPESLAAYEQAGVHYLKQDVVVDGNFITSNGPHAATPFAHAIVERLSPITAA